MFCPFILGGCINRKCCHTVSRNDADVHAGRPGNKQHTFIETETVRYVYQPIENLFLLLVTNKASNIVEDLETLRMLSKGAVITLLSVAVLGAGSAVHRNLRPGASTVS